MSSTDPNAWLAPPDRTREPRLRLLCFPYAGGGASIFHGWSSAVPAGVEVCAVRLPGRERRIREPLVRRIDELADRAAAALERVCDAPFALFGHSMGALLAFEVARRLGRAPARLFASGHRAPAVTATTSRAHLLPDAEFLAELVRLNGTPAEVLAHPELMELLVPVLRADFEACETYEYTWSEPLPCGITVYGGLDDREVSRGDLAAWQPFGSGSFELRMLPGDHFFLNDESGAFLRVLASDLAALIGGVDEKR